jgi:LemA protein
MLALAESYPDLKADRQFQALQDELVNTEDRLAAARRFYNGNVRTLNRLCMSFPTSLVARLGSFETGDFFEIEAAIQRSAPPVEP